jgi:hypothetical protein
MSIRGQGSMNMTSEVITSVQAPWRQSQKDSIYYKWESLPDDIKPQLKLENRYQITLGEDHYVVKKNEDGSFIVFKNTKEGHVDRRQRQQYFGKRSTTYLRVEIHILPIEQANQLLVIIKDFDLVGADPMKVVNEEFFAVIGKKEKAQ